MKLSFLHKLLLAICLLVSPAVFAQAADEAAKSKGWGLRDGDFDLTQNEFKHETRFGLVFSTGNTKSLTLSGNSFTLWRIRRFENKWRLGAFFNRIYDSTNAAVTPGTLARFIYGTYRLDYYLTDKLSLYVGGGGYTDEIKGVDLAAMGFTGVSYYFWRTPTTHLRGSVGYEYVHENRVAPNGSDDIHSAAEELEFVYTFNDHVSFVQTLAAFENVEDGGDARVNSDTELKAKVMKHLAVVTAFRLRFDNRPVPGFKKLDTITDVSLAVDF